MFANQFAHSLGAFLFFALLLFAIFCLKTFYCEFDSIHENDYFDQLFGRSVGTLMMECHSNWTAASQVLDSTNKKSSSIFRSFVFCSFVRFYSLKIEPKVTRLIWFPMNLAIETNRLTEIDQ